MPVSAKAFEFAMFGSGLVAALAAVENRPRLSIVATLTTFTMAMMAFLTAKEALALKRLK